MKINTQKKYVEASGFENKTSGFKIKSSPIAFKILSDKLYSDKVAAVIRELSCNAYDAHVAAGNTHEAFKVHLPNTFEPWFSIRDYGIGLSETNVINLYSTYFDSTKSDSNDFVGAMGLGSKSPFSYVDQFTVTSYFNGTVKVYQSYIGEDGTPSITKVSEAKTKERNGLEIYMMAESSDFGTFANRAKKIYSRFPVKPIIVGEKVDFNEIEYSLSGPNYRLRSKDQDNRDQGCVAIQGTVGYPINIKYMTIPMNKNQENVIENVPLDISFAIGELDIAPSREELSYDKNTQANILKAVDKVLAHVPTHAKGALKGAKTLWEAKLLWRNWFGNSSAASRFLELTIGRDLDWNKQVISDANITLKLFDADAIAAVNKKNAKKKTWINIHEPRKYVTKSDIAEYRKLFEKHKIDFYGESLSWSSYELTSNSSYKSNADYHLNLDLEVSDKKVFILVDDPTRLNKGIKAFVMQNYMDKNKAVYLIKGDSQFHQKIIDQLGGCPNIVLASQLEEVPSTAGQNVSGKTVTKKLYQVSEYSDNSYSCNLEYTETQHTIADGGLYFIRYAKGIVSNTKEVLNGDEAKVDNGLMTTLVKAQKIGLLNGKQVFAVNSSHKNIITGNTKWVCVWDFLNKAVTKKLADPKYAKSIADARLCHDVRESYGVISRMLYHRNTLKTILPMGTNNKFTEVINELSEIYVNYDKAVTAFGSTDVKKLCNTYEFIAASLGLECKTFDIDNSTKITELSDKIYTNYPVLSILIDAYNYVLTKGEASEPDNHAAAKLGLKHYIDLCDKVATITN